MTTTQRTRTAQILLLGLLGAIQVADPLITTLTLVKVSDELNFTASLQSLAAGISTFALAATVIPGGVLADRLGRRKLLAMSLILASVGQIITALGPDSMLFLLGRVITGVALGTTFAAAYGMIKDIVSVEDRGPALAKFNIVNTVFPLLVVVITGPLAAINWRLAFLILPVVSLIVFPLTLRMLPDVARVATGKVDYVGMLLIALGVAGLLVGISAASSGLENPRFWLPIALGIVALVAFGIYGARAANPVFPVKLLTHPAFLAAVLMGVIFNFASSASSQTAVNFWQYIMHMPTALVGIASLPTVVVAVIAAIVAGRLIKAGMSAGAICLIGCVLIVAALLTLLLVRADSSYLVFVPMLLLSGFGVTMVAMVQGNLYLSLAPARFFGPVTSSKTAVGQFGYSLGLTGTTVLVSIFTLNGVHTASAGAISGDGSWDAITSYLATGTTTDSTLGAIDHASLADIYAQAFVSTAVVSAIVIAVAAAAIVLLLRRRQATLPVDEFLGLADEPAPSHMIG
ncbi:MFS transporter [Leifsonia sp. H3M29-4]|uniref:MFS transporter n=1 Tax=Salinibacterium metalliresistens TaxID=3031321 RepID=UPI0023DA45EF|nr:MFS transporter [Salinibacterium metalliresistens]MDF1478987.1 MFS transporter [Salinibacterium metalliresistens]